MKQGLVLIAFLGLLLRLPDYDRLPAWREVDDEIHYAWTGMSWIRTGIPQSWSWLSSYPTSAEFAAWGNKWRLVSPMLEKPPLYSLLSGGLEMLFGHSQFSEVRLTTIRLFPIALGVITILLTGIVATQVFSPTVGLISALLYAVVPTIVMSNRISVTENLITPLSLLTLYIFLTQKLHKDLEAQKAALLGIVGGLSMLTKQIGLTVLAVPIVLLFNQKKWRPLLIVAATGIIFFLVYPLIGLSYDWPLFQAIQVEQRRIGLQGGLPQLLQTIVGRPLITTEQLFPDGTILLGYLLFFSSPFWLLKNQKITALLAFPFINILYLTLAVTGAEPGGTGQGFWGWYVYPLFPYLMILVAYAIYDLWKNYSCLKSMIIFLLLGSSTVRFFFLFLPRERHYLWQYALLVLLGIISSTEIIPRLKYQKFVLLTLFIVFIAVNIYTVINLSGIYPTLPQPGI